MKLRVARHTNDIQKIENFYVDILGFERLGSFENHSNYDGVFLGNPESDWHFEFTASLSKATHIFDDDDILVLYPSNISKYNSLINNIISHNISFITSKNPYWNENGKMIQDPDGYRIVLSSLKAI